MPDAQLSQLVILDGKTGSKVGGEFWHPGPLPHLGHADLLGDGTNELLAAGYDFKAANAVLLVFDPTRMPAQESPILRLAGFTDYLSSTYLEIVYFPPTDASATLALPGTRATDMLLTKDRVYVVVTESLTEANPNRIVYQLDYKLRVIDISMSYAYQAFYDDLFKQHRVKVPLDKVSPKYKENVLRWVAKSGPFSAVPY